MKGRVTGIGGVFFKAKDPEALRRWYHEQLGVVPDDPGPGSLFRWEGEGSTSFAIFKAETTYLGPPGEASFMINFRVDDLDALLARVEANGVTVLPEREEASYGRFAWVIDPEGNRVELWEPPSDL